MYAVGYYLRAHFDNCNPFTMKHACCKLNMHSTVQNSDTTLKVQMKKKYLSFCTIGYLGD